MTKMECLTPGSKQQNGFSLIEVLIALVILVIGLIGIFNLHLVAKRGSFESFQQTQASYYAKDIVNRMKLNRGQLTAYAATYTGALARPAKACDVAIGATSLCTPAETAAWDKYQWEQLLNGSAEAVGSQLVGGLDSPYACVTTSSTTLNGRTYPNALVKVVIAWRGIRESSDTSYEASDCGKTALAKRRRIFIVNTMII
ncbi:type IV pilus modification protein PilV [Shewanella sp. AS16]|uniref:type IV pilus modification protein PilV n=1 Tax=Shewanella sp. AS16 TaxID=2907625 RepID=UPI001F1585BF|nr:type IV pilus modification protein PilV [Shewanella sp. AS16]MCE9685280.1 type IV pilus modification protein PilV [Shewanella sp. AS16]